MDECVSCSIIISLIVCVLVCLLRQLMLSPIIRIRSVVHINILYTSSTIYIYKISVIIVILGQNTPNHHHSVVLKASRLCVCVCLG